MNTNKTVKIRGTSYKMYQNAQTNWVFVQGSKSRNWFAVAQIADGQIIKIDDEEAVRYATNRELANAWLNN